MLRPVGISDMAVSADPEDVLITYSLGSCVGLTLYDPVARVGGLLHCLMPESRLDPAKARSMPCMFVDTGVPCLVRGLARLGGMRGRLQAKLAGGASVLPTGDYFRIGERNCLAIRRELWRQGIVLCAAETGGMQGRTLELHVADGATSIRIDGRTRALA